MAKNVNVRVLISRTARFDQTISMPAADYKRLLQRLEDNDNEVGEEIFDWLRPDDFDFPDMSIDANEVVFEIEKPKRAKRS